MFILPEPGIYLLLYYIDANDRTFPISILQNCLLSRAFGVIILFPAFQKRRKKVLFSIFQRRFSGRCRAAFFFALVLFLAFSAAAQRLPVKIYTVGAGLAHNNVNRIFQDAKGFLWVATAEGLSRFDGYGFTNYGTADGLNQVFVNDVTADRAGNLWAATNGGGVSRLVDAPDAAASAKRKKFVSFAIEDGGESNRANFVNRIVFDAENRLWCLTDDGLYRARKLEVAERDFEKTASVPVTTTANAALADRRGRLWFNLNARLIEFDGANRYDYEVFQEVNNTASPTSAFLNLESIVEDGEGRIFAADPESVYQFIEPEAVGARGVWRRLPVERQPAQRIRTIAPADDGGLWIGTSAGLIHYRDGRQKSYTNESGLSVNAVNDVQTDREGGVWIGTHAGGLNKLAGESVAGYTTAEGLPSSDVYRFTADADGVLYTEVGCVKRNFAQIGAGGIKIIPVPNLRGTICHHSHLLEDARRRWWFHTDEGFWLSDAPVTDFTSGRLMKAAEIGLPESHAEAEMYRDADGNIWLADHGSGELYAADAKLAGTPQFRLAARNVPAEFIMRDAGGTIWLASRNKLWRLKNGAVSEITSIENLPRIEPRALFQDSRGRVWIGTRYNGVIVTDEPQAENPRFKNYTIADGLASGAVWAISEDDDGRIYLGTGRGVDRLDTATGKIKHFSNDDGIIGSVINSLFKDFQGNIWVASDLGISRINPRIAENPAMPPPVYINRILIAGVDLPLAETGDAAPLAPDLSAYQNNVTINFIGLSFGREHSLRYQYKLEGADDDWTQAGERREVNYANLGAGDYRFLVRAINEDGAASERAASFTFQIPRPVWQRAWFVALTALLAGGLIYLFYRRRISRLLEMERVRTRIATDLHDDIGANLTKIAILSEVAQQRAGQNSNGDNLFGSVAEISRESVSAMGDIVWAINPKKDSLLGLTRRMRSFSEEILERREIDLEFTAPVVEPDPKLDAVVRRSIYLIFKESVNNIVRHSNASKVEIDFRLADGELILHIGDNGDGFDQSREQDGNGLLNIEKRASDCGGQIKIDSATGAGTRIVLRLKLKSAAWSWR